MKPEQTIVIEGHLPPEAAAWDLSSLQYLPFDVPEGVTRIHIRREMDPVERQKVALLLYDPRGHGPGAPGFRGYQGAVNIDTDLTLTGDAETCTTWYRAGPLQPGRWHIGQWYLVPTPGGLGYRYTITLGFDGPPAPTEFAPVPAYNPGVVRAGAGWYAGSLHCHTHYSYDTHIGGPPRTAPEVIGMHAEAGYDFVAITDHNAARAHFDLASIVQSHPGMLLLFANELTTLNGHANTIGIVPGARFDFRLVPGDGLLPGIVSEVQTQGGVFIVNHPFQNCPDCAWRYPESEWERADAIEVWNREWSDTNRQAVDWWDGMLKAGRRIPAVGGSDYHRGDSPLSPCTWVHADNLSRAAVLSAIRHGRAFMTDGPRGPKVFLTGPGGALPGDTARGALEVSARVTGGAGCTLRFVCHAGESLVPVASDDATLPFSAPAGPNAYVRAELLRADGSMAAMTNPIFGQDEAA